MTVSDLLLAFMAAAVALAGFAGIVALIDRGAARVSPQIASLRVRNLVYLVVLVVVLSVTPLLAVLLGGGDAVWPVGCAAEAVLIVAYLAVIERLRRGFRGELARGMVLSAYVVMFALAVPLIALLIAGIAGRVSPSGAYAAGVFWFLLTALSTFMRLVFTLDDALRNTEKANQ